MTPCRVSGELQVLHPQLFRRAVNHMHVRADIRHIKLQLCVVCVSDHPDISGGHCDCTGNFHASQHMNNVRFILCAAYKSSRVHSRTVLIVHLMRIGFPVDYASGS